MDKTKTLGIYWKSKSDVLTYKVGTQNQGLITKRVITSEISQIFDPLGLVSDSVIIPKIL